MRFSLPSFLSLLLLGGSNISSVLAEAQDPVEATGVVTIGKPLPTLPASCLLQRPLCFTHTTTVTNRCPKSEIADCPTAPIACPAIIKITTTEVPCKTNCCPVTPTKTVTAPCLGCITRCVIPTETVTVTTGCNTKPTLTRITIPTLITRTIGIPLPTLPTKTLL